MSLRAAAGVLVAIASPVSADKLAAVTADGAALVGPSGQVYQPDGKGAWVRTVAGGVSDDVATAIHTAAACVHVADKDAGADGNANPNAGNAKSSGGASSFAGCLIVGADTSAAAHGPPFRFAGAAWAAMPIALHPKAVVSRGTRPIAAVGRLVFALDKSGDAAKLPDAPGPVLAIGASPAGVAIATDRGVARLDGKTWRAVSSARPLAFASDRWALVDGGVTDLQSGKTLAWPKGVIITAATPTKDGLVAAGATGTTIDLVTVHDGKLDHDTATADAPRDSGGNHAVVGIATDRDGRITIALADGRVVAGKPGAWTTAEVRDELPTAKPGSPPATSP